MTKQKPWSEVIKKRRLKWAGHLMRLPEQTPARVALNKFTEQHKRRVGRPKNTWLATLKKDLKEYNLPADNRKFIEKLSELTEDRERWKEIVTRECGMLRKE